MYTIGEFAAFGRVSVRMLRHYDAIGLLRPARVDAGTGYRSYSNEQLPRLLRIVELRALGVGLDRIAQVVRGPDEAAALRDALLDRRADLTASIADDAARIRRIDRRLRLLEGTTVPASVDYRPLQPVTVYALSGIAPGMGSEHIGPVIGPLIGRLDHALTTAGRPLLEPGVFWYDTVERAEEVEVHVSYRAEDLPVSGEGYDVIVLPAVALAATIRHTGDMSGIGDAWETLIAQVVADGYRITGSREVYLHAPGHEPGPDWVTELQAPVEPA